MSALHANESDWLLIRRADAEFILATLNGFGDWGFRPLDFERVRQARAVLERGLVTPDGEPVKGEIASENRKETIADDFS